MRASGYSIRHAVLAGAVVVLSLAAIGLYGLSRSYAERAADQAFDRVLAASALSIADAVQIEERRVTVDLPYASLAMLGAARTDRVFYKVEAPDRSLVTGYRDLGDRLAPARSPAPRFHDAVYRGDPVRIVEIGRFVAAPDLAGWVTVFVAETRVARAALAGDILRHALTPIVALGVVAIGLIWLGVYAAFRPLAALETDLRGRSPTDLHPLTAPAPREVRQLVVALNEFMARLDATLKALSAFVADAAHQVRTPLASLRAQAEVAAEETDPAALRARVARIHHNAVQATQLVNQLLMDATIAHRLETRAAEPVDLRVVIEEVRQRVDPDAAHRIVLDLAAAEPGTTVPGERVALREAVRNLVDNALRYAPDGDVTLRLAGPDPRGHVRVEVEDRGPGIPDAEKPLVIERFRRGDAAGPSPGSGLGLSIVRTVAAAHGGTLSLHDRPGGGLTARLDLPDAQAVLPAAAQGDTQASPSDPRSGTIAGVLLALGLALTATMAAPGSAAAQEARLFPPAAGGGRTLTIWGATDVAAFAPLIRAFQALRPDIGVAYLELETQDLHARVVSGATVPQPDLIVSSAIDLQAKLVNDGYALAHVSPETQAVPAWARWRFEAFGFTYEPAVMVYNPDLIAPADMPRSRVALARLIERDPFRWAGRIATYDIVQSGVGYLFATQDSLFSTAYWQLVRAFGEADVRLHCCTADILDAVERGDAAIGSNVLGSYAFARRAAGSRIGIVLPEDYLLVISRGMLISRRASAPDLARAFVDYVLSDRGQTIVADVSQLGSIMHGTSGRTAAAAVAGDAKGPVHPIGIGPSLLVYLDELKKARFLQTWRRLVTRR